MNARDSNWPWIVEFLLDHGADIHARDDSGNTPLHLAIGFKHQRKVVDLLLERGADMGAKNEAGQTACQLAKDGYFDDSLWVPRLASLEREGLRNVLSMVVA